MSSIPKVEIYFTPSLNPHPSEERVRHVSKRIITEDAPLTAHLYELVLNLLYAETAVLRGGQSDEERI